MANTSGADWDEGSPTITDPRRQGAAEILSLRKGTKIRADKEHKAYAGTSAGGEHKAGSAVSYYQTATPTLRPDGTTSLGADDAGRLWVHSTTKIIKIWSGSSWEDLELTSGPEIEQFYKEFTQPITIPGDPKTGLTANKQFMVWILGTTTAAQGNEASYTISVTVNSQSREIVIDNQPDGTAPFTMLFLVSSGASGEIEITAASNYGRIISMMGIRVS